MAKASEYRNRVTWLQATYATDTNTGEPQPTHVDNGSLWASVIEESGRRVEDKGGLQTGAFGTIRLRNYPAVTTHDLIRDNEDNVWHIETIVVGDNEMILDVYRNDELEDYELDEGSSSS